VSTEISPGFVVSRWKLTPIDCAFLGKMSDRFMAAVVERPEGRFAIVAVHPRSPRSELRWLEGNETVRALIALSRKLQQDRLPVVVLTDLNSSPTGWRSRAACESGLLRRGKPIFYPDGTYPDVVPINIRTGQTTSIGAIWPLSIAIDDALISAEIDVAAWSALDRLKSEHRPVIIDLRIPPPPASAANPIDR
jgi:endonuclease/exonuclease/phosphatase family metal-dependent hydrolase